MDGACRIPGHRADGGLADFININEIMLGAFASGYLGYAAFAGKAGCGLMAMASRRWSASLRRDGPALTAANIQPSNKPSISLVTRLGFRHEGFSPRYLRVVGAWRTTIAPP